MAKYRDNLPQLSGGLFLTDGGIETTLIFHEGLTLPDFAAFHLLGTPEGEAALRTSLEKQMELNRVTREYLDLLDKADAYANSLGDHFGKAFGDALEGSENLKRSLIELGAEILRIILLQQTGLKDPGGSGIGGLLTTFLKIGFGAITGGIGGSFGASAPSSGLGGIGGNSGLLGLTALGGAFINGHKTTAYANGGVVNTPTLFPMAHGMGLMGEAGPEAVMPLARGSDGKLGVKGGGTTVNVNVHNESNSEVEVNQNGDDIEVRILATVAQDIAKGGRTFRAMNQRFATNPRLNKR